MQASPLMKKYFERIQKEVQHTYKIAQKARKKGLDTTKEVSIPLAINMAQRVVGLISVVNSDISNHDIPGRIAELEKKFGQLDWRVGLTIAEEVAKEKFMKFKDKQEAIEIGIRVGFAYLTLGIVSAPLEGFIGIKIKKRRDGKEYLAIKYAGPIRGAGGTAASTSVILSDYVRVKMGYAPWDPDEKEVNRYVTDICDYHDRVTNLQYRPSVEEIKFMVSHLPIEVDGDPTEKIEVSNYKDLDRIETNLIRGGVALVIAEGLCQKAPKLWKRLGKWGTEMDLAWEWLGEFLALKEKIHASHNAPKDEKKDKSEVKKVKANNTFIMDLVAGRPILTHPLGVGGFRLRYGRGRTSGFSAAAVNAATLIVLEKYIAIGTQLKVERPGKACTITICDTLEGPIVRLKDDSVLQLKTEEEAKQHAKQVDEVLFLGDILFNYGDFSENGHSLVPAGYCPEWWALEVKKSLTNLYSEEIYQKGATLTEISLERLTEIIEKPLFTIPNWSETQKISRKLQIPLHPEYIFYWGLLSGEQLLTLKEWFNQGKIKKDEKGIEKIILPYYQTEELHQKAKLILNHLGVTHQVINKENIVIGRKEATIFASSFMFTDQKGLENIKLDQQSVAGKSGLEVINFLSEFTINDKAGTFIGARMGRPEKAKQRHLQGSPQVMFPVGEEGDRLRSFQSAMKAGKIRSLFPLLFCNDCQLEMVYKHCDECGKECQQKYYCRFCGDVDKETCRHGPTNTFKIKDINIKTYFEKAQKRIGEKVVPDLIKGVRSTSNKDHVVEHLSKGILRAKHSIYVNKEGTTRYDCTELPLTHFKPKEISAPVKKLLEIGYTHDIHGVELTDPDQLIELKPQDIILPGFNSLEESGPKVLSRVANYVDDLLKKFYKMKTFYNIKKEEDLIGHLVIGLAPHISAGMVGRIIGFSETQGLLTHPMFHAGLRRDCFHKDTFIPIYNNQTWHIEKISDLVEKLNPTDVVDSFGTKEIKVSNYKTINEDKLVNVNNFTKHLPQNFIQIKTKLGRILKVTTNHKQIIYENGKKKIKTANNLQINDNLAIPYSLNINKKNIKEINLIKHLHKQEWVMVRDVNKNFPNIKHYAKEYFQKKEHDNYTSRDSYPIKFINKLITKRVIQDISKFTLAAKRDTVKIPTIIPVDEDFLKIVGLYIAEGYSRKVSGRLYQMYIAAQNKDVRQFVAQTMKKLFGLKISENKQDRLTYSSRIVYFLFTSILKCGSSAYEKRIPSIFLNLPNKKLGHLLTGYFEGDGSVSSTDLRVTFDTVSQGLLKDLDFVFGQMNIFVKNYTYTSTPGQLLKDFYIKKGREIPQFTITKGIIQSVFMTRFAKFIYFISSRKRNILDNLIKTKKATRIAQEYNDKLIFDTIISLESLPAEESYCLNVDNHRVIANSILTNQCDGDEAAVMLLMDAFLNFSRDFLPKSRGSTMDAPLVLTSFLDPAEVDDQVHGMDVVWGYPLELYEAALEMKNPWDVKVNGKKIEQLGDRLGTPLQYENMGFTHHVDNFNKGIQCSAYKTLPSMAEKLVGQMEIARKVRAVDLGDVAKLVIQKHFLKDIKGNLRKFSMQQFRCVKCNTKYRRPPLTSKCTECQGKLIFTISHGSVIKYLGPSLMLCDKYEFSPYLKQTLAMLQSQVDLIFGKEKDKQVGLGSFIG